LVAFANHPAERQKRLNHVPNHAATCASDPGHDGFSRWLAEPMPGSKQWQTFFVQKPGDAGLIPVIPGNIRSLAVFEEWSQQSLAAETANQQEIT